MGTRAWLSGVLGAIVALAAAVGAFNAYVDPFQHYRVSTRHAPRFYTLHHRYINPGIARHAVYDSVVSGSSIMENTRADVVSTPIRNAPTPFGSFASGCMVFTA